MKPYAEEIAEARRHPDGRVYRIAGDFDPADGVPPEAIVGAWKVDSAGNIFGDFIHNPNYDPVLWPNSPEE